MDEPGRSLPEAEDPRIADLHGSVAFFQLQQDMEQGALDAGSCDLFCLEQVGELFKSRVLREQMIDPVCQVLADIKVLCQ